MGCAWTKQTESSTDKKVEFMTETHAGEVTLFNPEFEFVNEFTDEHCGALNDSALGNQLAPELQQIIASFIAFYHICYQRRLPPTALIDALSSVGVFDIHSLLDVGGFDDSHNGAFKVFVSGRQKKKLIDALMQTETTATGKCKVLRPMLPLPMDLQKAADSEPITDTAFDAVFWQAVDDHSSTTAKMFELTQRKACHIFLSVFDLDDVRGFVRFIKSPVDFEEQNRLRQLKIRWIHRVAVLLLTSENDAEEKANVYRDKIRKKLLKVKAKVPFIEVSATGVFDVQQSQQLLNAMAIEYCVEKINTVRAHLFWV